MEEQHTKNQEEKFLEESGLETIREVNTIMPTMIDDSVDDREVKQDISAIIPKYEKIEDKEGTELTSKDAVLKSDGSEILATIDDNGEAVYKANFQLPVQIDLKEKKEQQIKEKNKKKKKEKIKPSKAAKQQQTIISIGAFVAIVLLVAFYFLVYKAPGEEDFQPQRVVIELGDKLPIRTKDYVIPGDGKNVDELLYVKDTSKVILEEVGEYEFSITYKGITKYGTVVIQDTTPPVLDTRDVKIIEGSSYNASSFVESCRDHSGCNYSFQNAETPKQYTSAGSYNVHIVASDAYGNKTTKQANLFIEKQGSVKKFVKKGDFDFETGYTLIEEYELNFADYANTTMLFNGIYKQTFKYQDEEKYQAARKTYNGEPNYQCIDHQKEIVFTKSVGSVGNNYSTLDDIIAYFQREGYTEEQ